VELESFEDKRVCRMCRWPVFRFEYIPAVTIDGHEQSPEHLKRTCERCGWVVRESAAPATIDELGDPVS
jgi:hypothetical protein